MGDTEIERLRARLDEAKERDRQNREALDKAGTLSIQVFEKVLATTIANVLEKGLTEIALAIREGDAKPSKKR